MNTRLPQRLKARDDFDALLALEMSGGEQRGDYFVFGSMERKLAYERKLRELEGAKCKNI
ncbi:hypothetical protein [Paenibacillus humicus]|uniref:hypothetical protein n=1 Tax=Paenibacillus humicus TaxID=412861 RepID=UPI003D2D1C15